MAELERDTALPHASLHTLAAMAAAVSGPASTESAGASLQVKVVVARSCLVSAAQVNCLQSPAPIRVATQAEKDVAQPMLQAAATIAPAAGATAQPANAPRIFAIAF